MTHVTLWFPRWAVRRVSMPRPLTLPLPLALTVHQDPGT